MFALGCCVPAALCQAVCCSTALLTWLLPAPALPCCACCSVVVLNDIHIDIMDYIVPATCQDVQFRSMWAEFEWENKVGGQEAAAAAA